MFSILDKVINKSVFKFLDGYKMQIGGALAGISCALYGATYLTNPETDLVLIQIAEYAIKGAEIFGVFGGCGKIAKISR